MLRSIPLKAPLIALALAAVPLAGCVTDEYGDGYGYSNGYYGGGRSDRYAYDDGYGYRNGYYNDGYDEGYGSPYDVWYDGYYGPIDDGYWAGDGYFYYSTGRNRDWHRGESGHFRRDAARGNYRHYQFRQGNRGNYAYGDERRYGSDRDRTDDDRRDGNYDRSYHRGYR